MEIVFRALGNIEETRSRYVQPCDYMDVSLGTSQINSYVTVPNVILLQFVYMKKIYQEVVNLREFGFQSCWSSIGGFVGIFIGYSLLNFPETLGNLFDWIKKRNYPSLRQ